MGLVRSDVRPVSGRRHGDLRFSVRKPCAVLVSSRVLQLGPAAAYVPRVLQRLAPVQPSPWTHLGVVAVQPDDPASFVSEVEAWLRSETPTAPSPSPPQVMHSHRRLALLLPVVLGVGAFGVFSFSLPGGC